MSLCRCGNLSTTTVPELTLAHVAAMGPAASAPAASVAALSLARLAGAVLSWVASPSYLPHTCVEHAHITPGAHAVTKAETTFLSTQATLLLSACAWNALLVAFHT